MGTYEQGILGAFSGLVGPVVGANFRGKNVMRGRPKKSKKVPTQPQLAQRQRFSTVARFLTPVKEIVGEYFGMPAGTQSRYNLAMSYFLQEAVDFDGTEASIMYAKALFSKGNLMPLQNLQTNVSAGGILDLKWTDNAEQGNAKATDSLKVLVYEATTEVFEFYLDAGFRSDAVSKITLPAYLMGSTVECWAFMTSDKKDLKSTSQYLGRFIVI